jgi:octaprenyl-diphosphate synthase
MSSKSIFKEIKKPIADDLIKFEKHFRDSMKSSVPLLDKITYYIVQRKGKQVRPMFVFLCAKMCGEVSDKTYTAASLVELLHTGTLVHDDVVDDSYQRRGFFSINALWKNKIAVLVGDYLLSKGFLLALDNKHYKQLHILSTAVKLMSEGELLQIEKARKLDIEEHIYYEIIKGKTASLIAASCSAGAASSTEDEALIEKFRLLGETIGMAFQIKDDLFDYGDHDIGKPRGIDIKEKKMTLPLIYALNNTDKKRKKKIINIVKNNSEDSQKVKEVIDFVLGSGGIEYTESKMNEYKNKAMDILNGFPNSEAKTSLISLIDFVVKRGS